MARRWLYDTEKMRSDMRRRMLSQTAIASLIGASDSAVSRFLSGSRQSVELASLLATALGFPVTRYELREPKDVLVKAKPRVEF